MARPRKPTHILELSGAFKKDPARRLGRTNEPPPVGELQKPHACLSEAERACYLELTSTAPKGLLCKADSLAVEYAARLLSRFRSDPGCSHALQMRLLSILSKLGMTPADRTRLGA